MIVNRLAIGITAVIFVAVNSSANDKLTYTYNIGLVVDDVDIYTDVGDVVRWINNEGPLKMSTVRMEVSKLNLNNASLIEVCSFINQNHALLSTQRDNEPLSRVMASLMSHVMKPFIRSSTTESPRRANNLPFLLDASPSLEEIQQMVLSYITQNQFSWNRMVLILDETIDFSSVQSYLETASVYNWFIRLHFIGGTIDGSKIKDILLDAKVRGERYFILQSSSNTTRLILDQASTIGMADAGYHYFITLPVSPCELYLNSSDVSNANKTVFEAELIEIVPAINTPSSVKLACPDYRFRIMEHVLMQISEVLANTSTGDLQVLLDSGSEPSPRVCPVTLLRSASKGSNASKPITLTARLINEINRPSMNLVKVTRGIRKTVLPCDDCDPSPLDGSTLRIAAVLEEPFIHRNPDPTETEGKVYVGFLIDVLDMIAGRLHFNYTIELAPDDAYGALSDSGNWNGLIRMLMDGRADIALALMAVTSQRTEVVDFCEPIATSGTQAFAKARIRETNNLFAFFSPFDTNVWLAVLGAMVAVTITMFLINRSDPNEWRLTTSETNQADEVRKLGDFNILNSFWWSGVSLLMQGSEVNPRSLAGRILSGFWGFFGVMLIGYYTANLTAFLTVSRTIRDIDSIDGLSKQKELQYGILNNSALMNFLKQSSLPTYKRLWYQIHSNNAFFNTEAQAIGKSRSEYFAYLGDTMLIQYYSHKEPCDMDIIGKPFFKYGSAFALQKGSTLTEKISLQILKLQELGKIEEAKQYWLGRNAECTPTTAGVTVQSISKQIIFENMSGILYILIGGVGVSFCVLLLELLTRKSNRYPSKGGKDRNMNRQDTTSCLLQPSETITSSLYSGDTAATLQRYNDAAAHLTKRPDDTSKTNPQAYTTISCKESYV